MWILHAVEFILVALSSGSARSRSVGYNNYFGPPVLLAYTYNHAVRPLVTLQGQIKVIRWKTGILLRDSATCSYQGWAQDLLGRDRDQDRDLSSRDRDETETFAKLSETRPRRDPRVSETRPRRDLFWSRLYRDTWLIGICMVYYKIMHFTLCPEKRIP